MERTADLHTVCQGAIVWNCAITRSQVMERVVDRDMVRPNEAARCP